MSEIFNSKKKVQNVEKKLQNTNNKISYDEDINISSGIVLVCFQLFGKRR